MVCLLKWRKGNSSWLMALVLFSMTSPASCLDRDCVLGQHGIASEPGHYGQERLPKIALLWETRGELPFEPIWNSWLAALSRQLTGECQAEVDGLLAA